MVDAPDASNYAIKRVAMLAETSAMAAGLSSVTAATALRLTQASIEETPFSHSCWNRRAEDADAKAAALRPIQGLSNRAVLNRAAIRQAPGCKINSDNARLIKQATWPTIAR
jgi:hypothetical protein